MAESTIFPTTPSGPLQISAGPLSDLEEPGDTSSHGSDKDSKHLNVDENLMKHHNSSWDFGINKDTPFEAFFCNERHVACNNYTSTIDGLQRTKPCC